MIGNAIPKDRTIPALVRKARMEEATPRRSVTTAAMMAFVFGGWNRPDPIPDRNSHSPIVE